MSRAEKISVGVAVVGVGVTVVFGALSRGDVRMSAVLVTLMVGLGVVLMVGGFGFAAVSWLTGRHDPRGASQQTSPEKAHRPSATPSSASRAPSPGSGAGPPRQVLRTGENKSQRPVLPSVPDPPSLAEGTLVNAKGWVVDREGLREHLRAELTHGWELTDEESSGERKGWAQELRKTLAHELGERHANYFYRADPPKHVPSDTLGKLVLNVVTGGPSGQRSRSFLDQRLAKLEKIVGQL